MKYKISVHTTLYQDDQHLPVRWSNPIAIRVTDHEDKQLNLCILAKAVARSYGPYITKLDHMDTIHFNNSYFKGISSLQLKLSQ